MGDNFNEIKITIVGVIAVIYAFLVNIFGVFTPLLIITVGAMFADLITRIYAVSKRDDEEVKLKKILDGLYKKLGYCLLIILALMLDKALLILSDVLGINIASKIIFTALVMASRNAVPYNQCMYKVNPDLSMTLIGSLIGGESAYGTCIDIDPSNRWVAIGSKSGGTRCVLLNGSAYDHNVLYASNADSVFYKPRVVYYDAINNDIEYQGNRYRLIDSNYGDSLYRSNH